MSYFDANQTNKAEFRKFGELIISFLLCHMFVKDLFIGLLESVKDLNSKLGIKTEI